MRPDIWNNQSASDPNPSNWTAYTWPQHAALEGLTVDHVPAAGAIVVWPRNNDNSTGHVAYVQSVSVNPATGEKFVTLQEMNDTTFDDPSQGQGDTMTMSMDTGDLAGVQFIHLPAGAPVAPTTNTTSRPPRRRRGRRHQLTPRRPLRHHRLPPGRGAAAPARPEQARPRAPR
jgi:surface antigen